MQNSENLILLESNGIKGKYLCLETNEVIEAVGTIAVPREDRIIKYRGIVKWSQDISITKQVMAMKKICEKYGIIPNKNILCIARENTEWIFGEFFCVDAANIIEISRKEHLDIEMIDIEYGTKLFL